MARTTEKRGRRGCCLGCVGAVLLSLLMVGFVLWRSNQAPNDIAIPTQPMPAVNGYDDVKRACGMLKGRQYLFPASVPNYNPATYTLRDYVAAYREALPAFTALRAALPKPYRNPPCRSLGQFDSGYAEIREMARSLSGAAEFQDKIGRTGDAVDLLLDGEELGVTMTSGGHLITDLVGVAVEAISLQYIEPMLPKLSSTELARVAARLDRIAARRAPYSEIAKEEGWVSAAQMKQAFGEMNLASPAKYYRTVRQYLGYTGGTAVSDAAVFVRFSLTSKRAIVRDQLAYYAAASREVAGPYREKMQAPVPNNVIGAMLGDIVSGVWQKHVGRQAAVDVLRVEVALLRYRKDHGRYPDRLDVLAPRYLSKVPDDVCAGRAGARFRYLLQPGGYLLYSVGPDMRDDGGTFMYRWQGAGDIVAGHLNGR